MRALLKIVRNGNSAQVTIPRAMLLHCGLIPGQPIIVEVLEDRSIHIRVPVEADVAPRRAKMLWLDNSPAVPA